MQQCGHVQGERKLRAISPKMQIIIITANDKDGAGGLGPADDLGIDFPATGLLERLELQVDRPILGA
jgi:hypothetical protein